MKILRFVTFYLICMVLGLPGCTRTESTAETYTVNHYSAEDIFKGLYNTLDGTAKDTIDDRHRAALWFSKEMTVGGKNIFVVFIQVQKLDASGVLADCHACQVSIDAVTLTKKENGWPRTASHLRNLMDVGAWGKAPDVKDVEVLNLAPDNAVLLIPEHDVAQGTTGRALLLLAYDRDTWRNVGVLNVGSDNQGACTGKGSPSCYGYTSTLSIKKGDSERYPDLLVSKKGTDFDSDTSTIIPVQHELYRYTAGSYLSPKQEAFNKEQAQAEALAAKPKAVGWFTADVNHYKCFASNQSPADRIRMIQEAGFKVQTKDLSNGAVEVGDDNVYYTYFRSMEACTASLPRSQVVPSKYE